MLKCRDSRMAVFLFVAYCRMAERNSCMHNPTSFLLRAHLFSAASQHVMTPSVHVLHVANFIMPLMSRWATAELNLSLLLNKLLRHSQYAWRGLVPPVCSCCRLLDFWLAILPVVWRCQGSQFVLVANTRMHLQPVHRPGVPMLKPLLRLINTTAAWCRFTVVSRSVTV